MKYLAVHSKHFLDEDYLVMFSDLAAEGWYWDLLVHHHLSCLLVCSRLMRP